MPSQTVATPESTSANAPPPLPPVVPTDGELLRQFVRHDDRAALAQVVDRHAGMVWTVCSRLLGQRADAEDAYQATMLILARKAEAIRANDSAGGWLLRVAYRSALQVKRHRKARRETGLEATLGDEGPPAPEPQFPDFEQRQLVAVMLEELRGLPDKYQTPLVLRYLEGRSRRQIADATDSTVAAVAGHLVRGKRMLRLRLARRGVSLAVAMAAATGAASSASAGRAFAPATPPPPFDPCLVASGASAAVSSLVTHGVRSMLLASLMKPAAVGAACVLAALVLLVDAPSNAAPAANAAGSQDEVVLDATPAAELPAPPPAIAIASNNDEAIRRRQPPEQPAAAVNAEEVDLLAELVRLKEQRAGLINLQFRQGGATIAEDVAAAADLLAARIELAESRGQAAEVINQLEAFVSQRENQMAMVRQQVEQGEAPTVDLVAAQQALIEAKLHLVRAKQPPAPDPQPASARNVQVQVPYVSEAEVEALRKKSELAEVDFRRKSQLFDQGIESEFKKQAAEARYQQAKAAYEQAKARAAFMPWRQAQPAGGAAPTGPQPPEANAEMQRLLLAASVTAAKRRSEQRRDNAFSFGDQVAVRVRCPGRANTDLDFTITAVVDFDGVLSYEIPGQLPKTEIEATSLDAIEQEFLASLSASGAYANEKAVVEATKLIPLDQGANPTPAPVGGAAPLRPQPPTAPLVPQTQPAAPRSKQFLDALTPTRSRNHRRYSSPDLGAALTPSVTLPSGDSSIKRLSILGPVTFGGSPAEIDPPSDAEIHRAIKQISPPELAAILDHEVRFEIEKTSSYADPPRTYPLIGSAQMHHTHYTCKIVQADNARSAASLVTRVYLDHTHLHRLDSKVATNTYSTPRRPQPPAAPLAPQPQPAAPTSRQFLDGLMPAQSGGQKPSSTQELPAEIVTVGKKGLVWFRGQEMPVDRLIESLRAAHGSGKRVPASLSAMRNKLVEPADAMLTMEKLYRAANELGIKVELASFTEEQHASSRPLAAPAADLSPVKILSNMTDAYFKFPTYRDSGVVVTRFLKEGGVRTSRRPFTTAFVRPAGDQPGRFRYEFKNGDKRYLIAEGQDGVRSWWDVRPGIERPVSLQLAIGGATGVSGGSVARVPGMLMPSRLGGWGGLGIKEVKRIEDAKINEIDCYQLTGVRGGDPITVWIDKANYLLMRVEEKNELPSGLKTETVTDYQPQAGIEIADAALRFDPPIDPGPIEAPTPEAKLRQARTQVRSLEMVIKNLNESSIQKDHPGALGPAIEQFRTRLEKAKQQVRDLESEQETATGAAR